ncbi:thiamine phosphate synthase [Pelagicoccus sp. SDUM812002]|uniref:thiamine phosphate synthase n=1 Tax=Pelagicoccus sp. SDUM812002 TaxID=3041266 RepID=UPI00280E8F78|nr:thiamine phosphate synthase [Pelagicoccus sp. SDUM812002]MDQ8187287.1 thiamine phosphate synthase [Pelagicoccus sp. SDUM812002]
MNKPLEHAIFYGILDARYVTPEKWTEKYDALVSGGASIIQLRAKDCSQKDRFRLTEQILEKRAASLAKQPPLVINVDIETALRYPDLGLHASQEDQYPMDARERLGPNRLLGVSVHSREQADEILQLSDGIIDYFSVGPVFASPTKPYSAPIGLELIEYIASKSPKLPFFCIGGINRKNIREVKAAGASNFVTVSDVLQADDTESAVRETIQLARP